MFEQLNSRFAEIVKTIRGHGKITEDNISDSLRDVRRALLEADVNFKVAKPFVNRVMASASGKDVFHSVTPGQQFVKLIHNELTSFLGSENKGIRRLIKEKCDFLVKIPMLKNDLNIDSLNVSNAASILFYELSKK